MRESECVRVVGVCVRPDHGIVRPQGVGDEPVDLGISAISAITLLLLTVITQKKNHNHHSHLGP